MQECKRANGRAKTKKKSETEVLNSRSLGRQAIREKQTKGAQRRCGTREYSLFVCVCVFLCATDNNGTREWKIAPFGLLLISF